MTESALRKREVVSKVKKAGGQAQYLHRCNVSPAVAPPTHSVSCHAAARSSAAHCLTFPASLGGAALRLRQEISTSRESDGPCLFSKLALLFLM